MQKCEKTNSRRDFFKKFCFLLETFYYVILDRFIHFQRDAQKPIALNESIMLTRDDIAAFASVIVCRLIEYIYRPYIYSTAHC